MPSRTGTASQVDITAASSSTSVTVPGDATLVVATMGWYTGAGTGLATLTLNGVAFTKEVEVLPGAEHGVVVFTLENPATGSQTLAWSWTAGNTPSEGGGMVLTYVNDHNESTPVRDAGTDTGTDADNVEVTIDSETTDLVIAHVHQPVGGVPALAGTVYVNNAEVNSGNFDTSEVAAGSPTTTVTMTGEFYSAMGAISLIASGDVLPEVTHGGHVRRGLLGVS